MKLKYCPFCNYTATYESTITESTVRCDNGLCRASIRVKKSFEWKDKDAKQMLTAMWNRRRKK